MDKIEIEIKQDENTINDIAEKIQLVSNTNLVKKKNFYKNLLLKM